MESSRGRGSPLTRTATDDFYLPSWQAFNTLQIKKERLENWAGAFGVTAVSPSEGNAEMTGLRDLPLPQASLLAQ